MKYFLISFFFFTLFAFKSDTKADKIVNIYFKSVGGNNGVSSIKDITIKAKIKKNGIIFDEITYHKFPNKYLQIQSLKGVEFKRVYNDGKKISIVNTDLKGNQNGFIVNEKSFKMMNLRLSLFKYFDIEKHKPQKTYKSIITVGKTTCHEIEYNLDNVKWSCFFDTKTGLLLTETENIATQVNGKISNPVSKMTQNLGFIPINDVYFVLKSKVFENQVLVAENDYYGYEVNKNLKDEIFNIKK